MTFHTSCGLILRSRDFALPFCQIKESSHCTLTGRFLAESSFTKRAAVANISSPITAWSGCIWKTKLINKQIIHSQDPWLLACLNKWLVPPTYVQDIGAVLAKLVLSFEHGQSLKKKKVLPLITALPKCDQVVKRARYYWERMVKSCFWALKTHRRNQLTHPFSKVQVHNFCFPFTIPRLLQQWFCFSIQLVLINIKTPFSSCWTYRWEIIWFGSQCEPCASQVDLATLHIL